MKKLMLITAAAVYAFFAAGVIIDASKVQPYEISAAASETETGNASETVSGGYILRVVDGVVAAEDSDGRIIRKTDTRADILPSGDRERLRQGIRVSNLRELNRLIEDICS